MKNRKFILFFFTIFRRATLLHFQYIILNGDDGKMMHACNAALWCHCRFFLSHLIALTILSTYCCCRHMKKSILQYFLSHYSWWFTNKGSIARWKYYCETFESKSKIEVKKGEGNEKGSWRYGLSMILSSLGVKKSEWETNVITDWRIVRFELDFLLLNIYGSLRCIFLYFIAQY